MKKQLAIASLTNKINALLSDYGMAHSQEPHTQATIIIDKIFIIIYKTP